MIEDHDLDPLEGLPPELAELDEELRDLRMAERPSFGPELEAELDREWRRGPRAPGSGMAARRALAASIGAVILVSLSVPPARAALVELSRESLRFLGVPGDPPPAESRTPAEPPEGASVLAAPVPPRFASWSDGEDGAEVAGSVAEARASYPDRTTADASTGPSITFPHLADRRAEERAVRRHYPRHLQEEGVGGTVRLRLWVGDDGRVQNPEVLEASGVAALDRAALRAAGELRFEPARRGDEPVGTWVELDLVFEPLPEVRALPRIRPVGSPDLPPELGAELEEADGTPVVPAPYRVGAGRLLETALGPGAVERLGPAENLLAGEPAPGMSPLRWRAEAVEALEGALARDPENPAIHLALARIRARQGLRTAALETLDRGIERAERTRRPLDPGLLADLHYERGRALADAWLAWRSLGRLRTTEGVPSRCPSVSPRDADGVIALSYLCPEALDRLLDDAFDPADPAEAARDRMEAAYRAAVEADPAHPEANVALLLELSDREAWYEVLREARRFAWASRGHPWAALISGLALHRLGRVEDARADFTTALEGLDEADRERVRGIGPLTADREARTEAGRAAFWARLDPVLSTEVNEREVEHLARGAYALLRFGGPATEAGRVWIRYGPPTAIRALGEGSELRTELWDYGRGPDLTFRRPAHSLDLSLTAEARAYLEDLRSILPHGLGTRVRPVADLRGQVLDLAGSGGVRLHVHAAVPPDLATAPEDSVEVGLFLLGEDGLRVSERRHRIAAASGLFSLEADLPRSAATAVMELHHRGTGRSAVLRTPVARDPSTPGVSGLLLTEPAAPTGRPSSLAEPWIVPRPGGDDASGGAVGVVFQLRGLPDASTRYQVRAEVASQDGERTALRIRPAGQLLFDRAWSRDLPGGEAAVLEYLTVDLEGIPAGRYDLRVVVGLPGGLEPLTAERTVRVGPAASDTAR